MSLAPVDDVQASITNRAFVVVFIFSFVAVACGGCEKSAATSPPLSVPPPAAPAAAAPVVDAVHAARTAARAAIDAGDEGGAIAIIDAAIAAAGADAAVGDLRCDRGALRSRQAASTSDLRLRERALRGAIEDCPRQGEQLKAGLADTLLRRAREADSDQARLALLKESVEVNESVAALVDLAITLEKENEPAAAFAAADRAVAVGSAGSSDMSRVAALRDRLKAAAAVEGTFKSARHSHFVARFEGYGEERLAWGALDTLETAWFSVGKALDLYPRDPITVVIYTGEQYRSATAGPDWSTGLFDGKIRIREGQLAAERGRLKDTLVHEYVHAVLHTLPTQVPSWFHEGLAQHFEEGRPAPAQVMARTGLAPRAHLDVPFVKLPPEAVGAAYATAHAVVERMVERRGAWGLNQLIAELKGGRSFDDAVQRSFAVNVDALYREVAAEVGAAEEGAR